MQDAVENRIGQVMSLGRDDPETSDWGASTDHNFTTNKRRPASVETVKMSDSASNMSKPYLDTPTEKMSEPQQGAEQAIEVAMPASEEKVAPAPRGPALAGPEAQFQKFMNPMFAELEERVKEHERVLDKINDDLTRERDERIKAQKQAHIPEPLKGSGKAMKSILEKVGDLMLYEIEEDEGEEKKEEKQDVLVLWGPQKDENAEEEKKPEKPKKPVPIRNLDEHGQASISAHSLAAYVSCLSEDHLKKFTTKVTSDCQLWLSKMFRFEDASVLYHDEARDGLVRVCRLALYNKYPKYATEGFEALYSRPPVIYLSAASKPGLSHYLCLQLGLPMSCICTVPCNALFGGGTKMNTEILEKLIIDDIAAAKTPVLCVGYAGTPTVGHVDDLEKLKGICKRHNIWLHVEGNNLATLALLRPPDDVYDARSGDSLTVCMGTWLGVPALPFITLFKTADPSLVHAAGLNTFNPTLKLNCLPLWVVLQTLGIEGIEERITNSCDLAKTMFDELDTIKAIKQISRDKSREEKEKNKKVRSIGELISKAISSLLMFEMVTPTVVFKYHEDTSESSGVTVAPYAMGPDLEETSEEETRRKMEYFSALNIWLAETLQAENPRVEISAIDVEREGICIRFAPLESAQVLGTTQEDIEQFVACLKNQIEILDATVMNYEKFRMVVDGHENLRLIDIANWAGLGAVQYIPNEYLESLDNLHQQGVREINSLNMELVHRLKANDAAFSMGTTESDMVCLKFGLITEETDVEELVGMVQNIGKEVEQSSKYLESMSEMIMKGIEEASKDLRVEHDHKLVQEGVLRQVPVVGSLLNWWSPPPKNVEKGRRFDLLSGTIVSTEDTYKYHMQIQENTPPNTPRSSEPGSVPNSPSPLTKTAGDVKNKLMSGAHNGQVPSAELAVEATESVEGSNQKYSQANEVKRES